MAPEVIDGYLERDAYKEQLVSIYKEVEGYKGLVKILQDRLKEQGEQENRLIDRQNLVEVLMKLEYATNKWYGLLNLAYRDGHHDAIQACEELPHGDRGMYVPNEEVIKKATEGDQEGAKEFIVLNAMAHPYSKEAITLTDEQIAVGQAKDAVLEAEIIGDNTPQE